MGCCLAKRPFDDPTIGRSSRPLLKALSGAPMTGGTRAGGPGTGRTDSERIHMDIDATRRIGFSVVPQPGQAEKAASDGEFARVFDLADARRRRMTGPD